MTTISQVKDYVYRMLFQDAGFSAGMKAAADAAKRAGEAAEKAGDSVKQAGREVQAAGPSVQTLNKRYDENASLAERTAAANRRFAAEMRTLRSEVEKGRKTQEEANEIERRAALVRDQSIAKAQQHADAMKRMFGAASDSAGVTATQMQRLVPQFNDIFASITGGMPPLMVLTQQGPQIVEVFGGVRNTFAAVATALGPVRIGAVAATAAFAGMFAVVESGDRAMRDLSNRLRATREDYAALATTVDAAARSFAASSTVSAGDARAAGRIIASQRLFNGNQADLQNLLSLAQGVSKVLGTDLADAAGKVAAAMKAPTQAAQEMTEQGLRGMNAELLRSIERLENQGRTAEAARLVLDAYKRTVADAADNLTPLQRALASIGDNFQAGFERIRAPLTWVVERFADFLRIVRELDDFASNNALGRLLGLASQAQTAPAGTGTATGGVRDLTSADRLSAADRLAREIGGTGRERQDIQDRMRQLQEAMRTPGATAAQTAAYRDALASLREQLDGLKGPVATYLEGLKKQADLAHVADGAAREYAAAEQAVREAHGGAAAQAEARRLVEQRLAGEMMNSLQALDRQITGAKALAEAQGEGTAAAREAEAATRAQSDALKWAKEDSAEYEKIVAVLTARYARLAEVQAQGRSNAMERNQRQSLETLRTESQLLTANEAVRTRELALLRERQALDNEGIAAEDERYQRRLQNAAAIADQTEQLRRQRDVWGEIQSWGESAFEKIGDAVTEAFAQGRAGAVSFGSIAKAILSDLLQQILKLAVLRPIMNSVLGTSYGTLGDVGGIAGIASGLSGGTTTTGATGGGLDIAAVGSLGRSLGIGGSSGGMFGSVGTTISGWLNTPIYTTPSGTAATAALAEGVQGPVASNISGMTGGGLTVGSALGYGAGALGGAYGIYSGLQRGGVGGYTTAAGGAIGLASSAVGAATSAGLLSATGTLAALGPYGMIAAAVLAIVGSLLPGAKPSNRTGTSAVNLGDGSIEVYGQTGSKFSAENRAAAQDQAQTLRSIGSSISQLVGGVGLVGRATIDVGSRDGLAATYMRYGQVIHTGKYSLDDEGAAQMQAFVTSEMINDLRGRLPEALDRLVQSIPRDTVENMMTKLAQAASATSGGKPSEAQNIASRNIDVSNFDAAIADLQWVKDVYEPLQSTAAAATQYQQQLDAIGTKYQTIIDQSNRLGLATDKIVEARQKEIAALEAQRTAYLTDLGETLDARMRAATGTTDPLGDALRAQAKTAAAELEQARTSLKEWGISAEETAAWINRIEMVQGAERARIVEDITAQMAEAAREAAEAARQAVLAARQAAREAEDLAAAPGTFDTTLSARRLTALDLTTRGSLASFEQRSASETLQARRQFEDLGMSAAEASRRLQQLAQVQALERAQIVFDAAKSDYTAALNAQIAAAQSAVAAQEANTSALLAVSSGIRQWLRSLSVSEVSPLTPEQRLAELRSQFGGAMARASDPTLSVADRAAAAQEAQATGQQLLTEAVAYYGQATAAYQEEYTSVASRMSSLANSFDAQAETASAALAVARSQLTTLQASLAWAQGFGVQATAGLDALREAMVNALGNLNAARADVGAGPILGETAPGNAAPTTGGDFVARAQAYLRANPDVAAAVAQGDRFGGTTASQYEAAFMHYVKFGKGEGRAFAGGGLATPGLALVGEEGPELVRFRQPGRVYTATQTREVFAANDSGVIEELRALRAEVAQLRRTAAAAGVETVRAVQAGNAIAAEGTADRKLALAR